MKTHLHHFVSFIFFGGLLFVGMSCQKEFSEDSRPSFTLTQINNLSTAEADAILLKYFDAHQLNAVLPINQPDEYKAFLGRVLFYDSHLSVDRSVSCASCHQQQFAFADQVALSTGANGNRTDRNSISLASHSLSALGFPPFLIDSLGADSMILIFTGTTGVNWAETEESFSSALNNSLFWDGRVQNLQDQMLETFTNPKEMGMDLSAIPNRIEELEYATILYNRAFEGEPITTENVIASISAFLNRIQSTDALFDKGLGTGINASTAPTVPTIFEGFSQLAFYFDNFSDGENNGKRLFLENCASCHASSLGKIFREQFDNINHTASNGLDLVYTDKGLGSLTNVASDDGVFKIPGLRNVELTAPYMHDGRFATLEEVVDFYSTDIQAHPNLDPRLTFSNGTPIKMEFNEYEKADLVAFLKTLTGSTITTNEDFADPFK